MDYKNFKQIKINDFSFENVKQHYQEGFLFTRIDKGVMDQVYSLRIKLENFNFNSENRRILRKLTDLEVTSTNLPINEADYDFNIHRIGKDFYFKKNNDKVFSASKIKELVTSTSSNFNVLLTFKLNNEVIGFAICYKNEDFLHYAYPFYELDKNINNLGMGMILRSIELSLEQNLKYFYMGSVNSSKNLYKLQFNNLEWWNINHWNSNLEELKQLFTS